MPWKEVNVMSQKIEFVIRAMMKQESFLYLCREYGITTKTGYKWRERFLQKGRAGLEEESRRPKSSAQTAEDIICELVRIKKLKSNWGPKKIRNLYEVGHPGEKIPSLSTVSRILEKSGFVKKRKQRRIAAKEAIQNRVVPEKCNDLWTVDFKGYWHTSKKEKVEPLTVRDEYSKYIFSIAILEKGDTSSVKREFERLFREYGLPKMIRSDNGPPFASRVSILGLTKLSVWWMSLGIQLDRTDPGSPQQNGGHERLHRDIALELEGRIAGDLTAHRIRCEEWRVEFNEERPHESLGMKTPASVYEKSERKYEEFDGFDYPPGFQSRQVNNRGYTNLKGRHVFISNAFNGYNVGLKITETGWEVWFETRLIGWIDPVSFVLVSVQEKKDAT
jgi:transposase InsO family protein